MIEFRIDDDGKVDAVVNTENPIDFVAQSYAMLCILTDNWKKFMNNAGYTDNFTFGDMLDVLNSFTQEYQPDDNINLFKNISIDYDDNRGYRFKIENEPDKIIVFPTKEIKS